MFKTVRMDWDFSIERNREPLLRHVLELFALIGLVEGGMVERVAAGLPAGAHNIEVGRICVRRLIIVIARVIKVELRPKRVMPKGLLRSRKGTFQGKGQGNGKAKGQAGKAKTGDHVHFLVLLVTSCDREVLFAMTAVCDPRHTLDHSTSLGHPRAALGAITGRPGSASNC